jgi:hypothetical protein
MPHAAKVNEIQKNFESLIEPYMQPGNVIAHGLYDQLPLPWETDPNQTVFPKEKFQRFDWDRDGLLSDGKDFLGGSQEFPLEIYKLALGTVSSVTRWREAHPELVGSKDDPVIIVLEQMREVLGETMLRGGGPTALLMFTRGE